MFTAAPVAAQSAAFTYQGKLADNGNLANAAYDMQFKLFDNLGTQIGATLTFDGTGGNPPSVSVSNGIFTVTLDFGATAFPGADRYLEIAVRTANTGSYTTLSPRQPMLSTPYAIKSLNAATAEGLSVAASANFIQNGTSQQTATNFNISGDGTAGGTLTGSIVNAVTQYNLNGLRVFTVNGPYTDPFTSLTASNIFVGEDAGVNTTPDPSLTGILGKFNSFFGNGAGQANTTGNLNAFFSTLAGNSNTTGERNSFFGIVAGRDNTTGSHNSFFGNAAGASNTTGSDNAFFGTQAGVNNTACCNAFFGSTAGFSNTTGVFNAFFGGGAGFLSATGGGNTFIGNGADFNTSNPTGNSNTLLGYRTRVNSGLNNATAIGAQATVTQSNSLVLGAITGINGGTSVNVGIGTTAPAAKLDIQGGNVAINNNLLQLRSAADPNHGILYSATVDGPEFRAFSGFRWTNGAAGASERMRLDANGNLGIGTTAPAFKLDVNGELRANIVRINSYVSGGTAQVCVETTTNRLGVCNSSLRYKTAVQPFNAGLTIINRLQPIRYRWKQSGMPDLGLAAEEVEKVEPLLTFRNTKGEVDGVKYNQLSAVFINAFKEQQAQIKEQKAEIATLRQELRLVKQQKELIRQQQQEMAAIRRLLCASHPRANLCKAKLSK